MGSEIRKSEDANHLNRYNLDDVDEVGSFYPLIFTFLSALHNSKINWYQAL